MKVIGKDRTSCDVCNPIDEILARLDALERRASAIVAKVQGLAPDGEGNVTLPTSSSDTDPLHGRIDAFAMSSEVKEAADDAHAYAASIADDVVVINSEIDAIKAEIEAIKTTVQTLQTADTQNVKLDTAQVITGHKKFVQASTTGVPLEAERKGNGAGVSITQTDQKMTDAGVQYYSGMYIYDSNGNRVGGWYPVKEQDGRTTVRMRVLKGGETKELIIDPDIVLSTALTTKAYVESTDGVTNNLVHRTANEKVDGIKTFVQRVDFDSSTVDLNNPPSYASRGMSQVNTGPNLDAVAMREEMLYSNGGNTLQFIVHAHGEDEAHTDHTATLMLTVFRDGTARLRLVRESGTVEIVPRG